MPESASLEAPSVLNLSQYCDYKRMTPEERRENGPFGRVLLVDDSGRKFTHVIPVDLEHGRAPVAIPLDRLRALAGLALPVHEVSLDVPDNDAWVSVRMWALQQLQANLPGAEAHGESLYWDGLATGLDVGLARAGTGGGAVIGPYVEFPLSTSPLYIGDELVR